MKRLHFMAGVFVALMTISAFLSGKVVIVFPVDDLPLPLPPPPTVVHVPGRAEVSPPPWNDGGHFLRVASTFGKFIDKTTHHHYEFMYSKYLDGIRMGRHKMLEIGLGCDMVWGPGWSYQLWRKYLPNTNLTYADYIKIERKCFDRMRLTSLKKEDVAYLRANTLWGDQTDTQFLKNVAKTGPYDIIIDDGAHSMDAQMNSLFVLFPSALKPGGIYFLEDLQSSYHAMWGGTYKRKEAGMTTVEAIKDLIGWRHNTQRGKDFVKETLRFGNLKRVVDQIRSIDCDAEICVFVKKTAEEIKNAAAPVERISPAPEERRE